MADFDALTTDLARKVGIHPVWRSRGGVMAPVSIETQRALLDVLGYPCRSADEAREQLATLDRGAHGQGSDFVTARVGDRVTLPGAEKPGSLVEVAYEEGETRAVRTEESGAGEVALPPFERPGYHRVRLSSGECVVATGPKLCLSFREMSEGRRGWGIAAQTYSLGSGTECGIGDFGGVAALAVASARLGADLFGISPAHATLGAPERFDSPYAASSRQFLNPIYADPALVLADVLPAASARPSSRPALIDWRAAKEAKTVLLSRVYDALMTSPAPQRAEFEAFRAGASKALNNHALFETIRTKFLDQWDWRNWPEAFRSPESGVVQTFAREHAEAVSFQIFQQWLTGLCAAEAQSAAKQAGMSVGLIADVAVGVDPAGSDAWSDPHSLIGKATIGAPSDAYTPAGQNWQVTTFSLRGLQSTRFAPFIATLRACLRHVGGIRIDHIMGLQRLWVIPDGFGPKQGGYVTFPAKPLFDLLALESWRSRAIVIGEVLGTLPHGFREYVADQGVSGTQLLRIERKGPVWKPPQQWDRRSAALTATHDIIATAGWWKGADLEANDEQLAEREKDRASLWSAFRDASVVTGDPPPTADGETVVDAAFDFVAQTPCEILLLSLEDVLATDLQPNTPGTTAEKPNWRHRYLRDVPESLQTPRVASRLAKLGAPR